MLAHQEQIDTGNNLLKIADGQAMMSAESYESELAYQQNVHEQSHYYQHHGFEQQQQQQHYNSNGHPNDHAPHNLHPHHQQHHPQQLSHPQEYYHQQQLMYNQGMSNYNYPSDQYYYQQHPQSNAPHGPLQQGSYPFQPSQNVVVNSGPASHGSHNCTPSPHANSDDSGGDCVNEPKVMQIGAPSHYPQHGGLPYSNQFNHDPHMNERTLGQKTLIASTNINRNLTAPRRGKKSKHRDPNEPQKPVSAYALFFRDTQAGIKIRNPNSSFGDVSKHVASLWDGLDPENKAIYKRRTETAKKEYLKSLAAYRASLVSKGGSPPCNPGPEPLSTRYPENAMQSERKDLMNLKDSMSSPNSQTLLGSPPSSYQPLGVIGRTSPHSSQVMFARALSVQNGDNVSSHFNYQQPHQNLTLHQATPHNGNNNPQFMSQSQPQLTKLT